MEGLVDYVRKQVKCPECRAEHRVPYNGIQGFPANVTLQRFLDAQLEITGEAPDPHTGQMMERCNVCNEKEYLELCAHCEKKICEGCKTAHGEVLKREIGRINNQVRRASHRLTEHKDNVERSICTLKTNTNGINEEIENISKRLQKAIRDREDYLKCEVQNQFGTEMKTLEMLREGLQLEIQNINSNVECAEKHMDDGTPWDDAELMDTKDIFLKTMEFIRTFDFDGGGEYSRKTRFNPPDDLNKLASSLSSMGELCIPGKGNNSNNNDNYDSGQNFSSGGLSRSKSDHRLAVQFREQEDKKRTSPFSARRFGERPPPKVESAADSYEDSSRRKFRSRFIKREDEENEEEEAAKSTRPRAIDTEDVSRGPLSGIVRILDSPRAIQRLQERDTVKKKEKDKPPPPPAASAPSVTSTLTSTYTPPRAARQVSEDEIDKIKKENKSAESAVSSSSNVSTPYASSVTSVAPTSYSRTSTPPETNTTSSTDDGTSASRRRYSNTSIDYGTPVAAPATSTNKPYNRYSRDNSAESNLSHEDASTTPRKTSGMSHVQSTLGRFTSVTEETPAAKPASSRPGRYQNGANSGASSKYARYGRAATPSNENSTDNLNNDDDDDEESSEDTESDSEESSEEEEEEKPSAYSSTRNYSSTNGTSSTRKKSEPDTSYSSRYGTNSNDTSSTNNYGRRSSVYDKKEDEADKYSYTGSKYLSRNKEPVEEEPKSSFSSRFLNRSKSSAVLGPDAAQNEDDTSTKGSGRQRFEELKEKRQQRIARSKSSAGLDDDEAGSSEPAYKSRYSRDNDTSSNASSRVLGSKEESKEEGGSNAQLSTWARYLKNKYGNKTEAPTTSPPSSTAGGYAIGNRSSATNSSASGSGSTASSSSTTSQRAIARSRSSHLLGLPKDSDTTETESSKNVDATPTFPAAQADTLVVPTHHTIGGIHRNQYLEKQNLVFQIGGRGSEPGNFTWPRGIAVGPNNSIVVADSSNHRVQVFDENGEFDKEFGSYGSHYAEFDCLAGVAVSRIGQFVIADRYNHRIQIFDPSGMFIRSFGSHGNYEGQFSYPWGVATDSYGYIYVCDKENHRIQVFETDGVFVRRFGGMGSGPGQLQHPHYVAVSSTNKVVVSDSNNHRIQIFDASGTHLTAIGGEGAEEGKFKFPRGVAVDEDGNIIVADSGNNRIQVFNAEGQFLKAFGRWGSDDTEFKGLEGVAVTSNGTILVCDRENHRVQIF